MLILIRRIGEEIYIDKGRIKITLLHEKDGLIGIGVRAPKNIEVDRKEIFIRKVVAQHSITQEKRDNKKGYKH
ncbi:Carbon storage regulator [Legionella beliardensis]|uniref:Carbon storage regulator n=1 Tax=Legionella beliardensis TaxID=91822 RepID=A0A378I1F9_9GAMM|nr:carbon storage regulator [Legionella beliardensis]STX28446.1 Carbon storage regulator [Legionella beliardensis]